MPKKTKKTIDFSKEIDSIDKILEKIEQNDDITKSIEQYEQGLLKIKACKEFLENMQNKIEEIED